MSACPNVNSPEWKTLLRYLNGNTTEAYRVFIAQGSVVPNVKKIGDIKKDLQFKTTISSEVEKNLLLGRLSDYNNTNNTSFRIETTKLPSGKYKAKLVLNFMPSYGIQHSGESVEVLNNISSSVSVETTLSPEDSIQKNDNGKFEVGGKEYDSYSDAVEDTYKSNKTNSKDAVSKLDEFLKSFLSDYGITVDQVNNFEERFGFDGVAAADIANKVIVVAKDQADFTTLPEEAAHFIIEMMGQDNALYQAMYKNITKTKEYSEVVEDYSELYNGNESKLRKEAMGKVLAKYIIKRSESAVDLPARTISLLDKLVNWVRKFFGKIDNSVLEQEISNIYGRTANMVFNKDTKLGLSASKLSGLDGIFAQLPKLKESLSRSVEKLNQRASYLERKASEIEDDSRSESMRIAADNIKRQLEAKETELALVSFFDYINSNELKFMVDDMNSYRKDPSSIKYGSEVINRMKDSVVLYESLIADVNKALKWSADTQDLYVRMKEYIDATTIKIGELKEFIGVVSDIQVRKIVNELKAEGSNYNIDELLYEKSGDIGMLSKLFGPLHAANDEILKMVYKLILDVKNDSYRTALSQGKDLIAAQLEMEKAGHKDMSVFHEKDSKGKTTGYLISDVKWGEYNDALDQVKFDIAEALGKDDYGEVDKKELSVKELKTFHRLWGEFNKKYSIYSSEEQSWVPNPPKNEEFERMMKVPSMKNYYDILIDVHNKSKNMLPKKYKNSRYAFMLPQIRKDIIQTLKYSDGGLLKEIGSRIKENFVITEDDVEFGDVSQDVILDINGKAIKLVPLHFVSKLSDLKGLSNDITSMYAAFSEMANNFRSISNRLDDIMMIRDKMGARKVITKTDTKLGSETNAYQSLNDFMDAFVYGEEKEKMTVVIAGKEINLGKIGDKFLNFVRQKNLFMNLFTTLSGYTKASIDSKIEDMIGLYTTQESKWWAEKEFDKNIPSLLMNINKRSKHNKMELMFEYNGIFAGMQEAFNRMDIDNRLLRTTWSDIIYSSYELFDTRVKGKLSLAIYDNYRLVDGKFITRAQFKRSHPEGDWKSYSDKTLYNAYEVKGNKLVVKPEYKKYVTNKLENTVKGTINHRANAIDGQLNQLDKASINRKLFGRAIMLHRGWLISGAIERFKSSGINYITNEQEEGYYRTMWNAVGKFIKTEGGLRQKLGVWNTLEEYEKRGVYKTLADLAFSTGVMVAYMLMNSIADDDDDDMWFIEAMAYLSTRILMEQTAFQNPTEILNILNSPTAATSTLESIKDFYKAFLNWDEIETGPYKGMHQIEKGLIKNSLLKNLYEVQFPAEKNKYVRTQLF